MVHIDLTKPDREFTPGVDLWEIREATHTRGRNGSGDPRLNLKLVRVTNTSDHLYDVVMLDGKGWGIGKAKLQALLPAGFAGDLDPLSLVGRRLWVETMIGEYEGKSRLQVNIKGLKHSGFQAEEEVPAGKDLSTMPDGDPLTPF